MIANKTHFQSENSAGWITLNSLSIRMNFRISHLKYGPDIYGRLENRFNGIHIDKFLLELSNCHIHLGII